MIPTTKLSHSTYAAAVPDGWVFDSRGAIGDPRRRGDLLAALARSVADDVYDVVGGIANSGTLWAALLAARQSTRFCNVLVDGPRAGGLRRSIEPTPPPGARILLIDNWITSGNSVRDAIRICEVSGLVVVAAAVVAGYGGSVVEGVPLRTGVRLLPE